MSVPLVHDSRGEAVVKVEVHFQCQVQSETLYCRLCFLICEQKKKNTPRCLTTVKKEKIARITHFSSHNLSLVLSGVMLSSPSLPLLGVLGRFTLPSVEQNQ